jgi:hypothetical protein
VLGLLAPIASARQGRVPGPALGDWEGVGPHGLPLTFVLAKKHNKIVISNLAVGFPVNCPNQPTPTAAVAYKVAEYGGPGAQPRVRLPGWRPTDIVVIGINRGEFALQLDGRLLARRRAVLSMGMSPRVPKNCGWPRKRVTWKVRPRHRLDVAAGTWTGTVTVPDGTGTVAVQVTAGGRIVNLVKVAITCTQGGGGGFQAGPPAEEFIAADGAFEGWGYAHWLGHFGSDGVLNGTFTAADSCGAAGQIDGTFTAQHTGP